ncbi:hypothetical protein BCR44DRAFT_1284362 [Catenaria anguillulae PL171]|uniref:WD40-repeat-containing domain protein n=1 Tax=Catenaria anguillulae PL171 TaxID=765915 RepID=A0A1Y2HWG2_9FUNG|nr:hypothetical protein BCR44DRAFT_1284362 [Catenaria anguillulae PL171]
MLHYVAEWQGIVGDGFGHPALVGWKLYSMRSVGRLGKKCHQGAIEYIAVEDGDVITAGEDGYIRTWDLEAIEGPEPTEGKSPTATTVFELEPLDELFVGKDVKIKCMRRMPVDTTTAKANKASATAAAAGVDYLAADGNGALWRVNLKSRTSERIWSFPSGPIHAIDTCQSAVHHLVISAGQDGTVRVNDPLTRSHSQLPVTLFRRHASSIFPVVRCPRVLARRWVRRWQHSILSPCRTHTGEIVNCYCTHTCPPSARNGCGFARVIIGCNRLGHCQ